MTDDRSGAGTVFPSWTLSSSPRFSGVRRVSQSLVFFYIVCVCLLVLSVELSIIYGFLLPIWYLQTFFDEQRLVQWHWILLSICTDFGKWLVVIGTNCISSCKSNYHTIRTTMIHTMYCWFNLTIYINQRYNKRRFKNDFIQKITHVC